MNKTSPVDLTKTYTADSQRRPNRHAGREPMSTEPSSTPGAPQRDHQIPKRPHLIRYGAPHEPAEAQIHLPRSFALGHGISISTHRTRRLRARRIQVESGQYAHSVVAQHADGQRDVGNSRTSRVGPEFVLAGALLGRG